MEEAEQLDVQGLFAGFAEMKNQLKLVKNMDPILNWKPLYAEDVKGEVYPALMELETNAFRRGPPGCEMLLRSLMHTFVDKILMYMSEQIEQDPVCFKFKFELNRR